MLPPPALPVPSWFNSNDHIWSSSAGAGSREDDQAETCQQSGFANEQQQQLERHEAMNLIRGGGGSLINAIGRRDSVSSSNLTETTSENAQHTQPLDQDQIHKGRRAGGLGLITAGQFEATSSEGQDDQYHSIGQAGGGMRILDSSFGLQYGAGTADRQQLLMNDYHQWQQQQQQHLINPANIVALSSSNSANSSLSPFQQQQQQQLISGFPCKLEPADQLAVVDSMNNALLVDFHKNNSSSNHNKNLSGMTMAQSNLTSASGEASVSSGSRDEATPAHPPSLQLQQAPEAAPSHDTQQQPPVPVKKKRNLPGTPDPDAEVIALSPKTLLATNRFVCEICSKGFQRDQNLQLHRRGHNLPWKLRQRTSKEVRKRVYICPEVNCVHHDPARALGDLTGIKKHFCRKHGEKKWKCDKCSKRYAVQSDWKAHMKTCGTREYRCDCGTLFSRRDSFITHRAFCDALAEENSRVSAHTQVGGDGSGQSVLSSSSADQMMSDHNMMGGAGGGDHHHHRQLAHHALGFIQAGAAAGRALQAAGGLHSLQPRPQQQINSLINDSATNMISSLAAAQSKWDPSNPMGLKPLITPSPKLSLWLGNGPAGLINQQNDSNQLLHNLTGSSHMVSDSSFFMQPPNARSGNQLSCGNNNTVSSHNLPPNPFFNSDHNAMHGLHNSLGNNSNIAAGHHVDQGVLNQRISGSVDHTFGSPAHMMMNASSSNNNSNNSGVSLMPSMYNHDQDQQQQQVQAAAANAQMSATALLQKAAMMGATASNSPLFRNFNGSSMAPASSSSGTDHSQDQHNLNMPGSASSMASIMTNQQGIFMRPSSSSSSGSHIMNGSAASHSAMSSIQGLLYSHSGPHPMDRNITGGGQSMSGIHADMINRYNNPGTSNYNISQDAFSSLMQDKSAVMSMNQARVDQAEGGHDHKPTLDFLGIGGSAAASGSHNIHPRDQMSADNMMSIAAGPSPGMEFLSSSAIAGQKDNNLLVGHHKSLGSSSPERSPEYSS